MHKRILIIGSLFLALGLALPAKATPIVYTATLLGSNEVGPTGSAATGFGTFTLNGNLLTINESFTGLSTSASAAHIHCCAPVGVNAAVAVPFSGFPAATSGTFINTVDLSDAATYTLGFINTVGGGTVAGAESAFIAALNSGNTYANIHDPNFPSGEIRGQINVVTPEPASLLLFATGMVGIVQGIRRRVRA